MAWLAGGYSKRKPITVTGGASGAQANFQLKLAVAHDADMQADFDDLRFTRADGTTLIDAWLESKVNSTSSVVWAEFPTTPANTVDQTYYMYYGNAGAASDWDGAATFEFFDNFEDNDVSDWSKESGANIAAVASPVKNGTYAAQIYPTTNWAEAYKSVGTNLSDRIFEFYAQFDSTANGRLFIQATGTDSLNGIYIGTVDGNIKYYDGSWNTLQAFSIDTWYRFKITTHPSADTFDIDIDGVNKGNGLGVRGSYSGGVNAISFTTAGSAYDEYVDMIFMRKYAANPPTYAFGAEEDAPVGGVAPTSIFYGPFMGPFGGAI